MIDLASASAELRLDVNNFVTNAQRASDAAQGIQQATNNVTSGGFLGWVTDNEQALNRWGKGLLGFGALVTGSFAAPIIAGSRATWGQVDAIEQATVAMNAYADSSEDVDMVLGSLLDYARSAESGGLFWREELFASAQSMLIYGASIEEVDEYVKILSRSVGLGLSDWDSLNTIIGRVGSTGRLTGNDFDMLTARGFTLDESIRNTDITWQEFFGHLDAGIPADALAGQMDTIRGKGLWLQDALQGLGRAFLGVDSESGKFIEGGLGWQMVRGMERLTDLMLRAAPAVGNLGSIFAAIGRPIGMAIDFLIRLPQPIQTAMLMFTGATGVISLFSGGLLLMLPRIASTIAAFQALGGVSGILGGLTSGIRVLGTTMWAAFAPALPVILAVGAAIAALSAAFYVLYQSNFLGFADFVDGAVEKLQILIQGIQQAFGTPHHNTGNFDIHTTSDNVWDQWQQQPDGSWKNADLDITSTTDDGAFEYMGYDEETGKWVVMHISSEGEIPGEIVDSSRNPNNPTQYFWTIELDDGGTVTAIYDEVEGTIELLEGPHELNVDAGKAYHELTGVEKAAADVNLAFWAAEQMAKGFWDMVTKPVDVAINGLRIIDDNIQTLIDVWSELTRRVDMAWEAIDVFTGLSWREMLDIAGLEGLIGPIETMIEWWNKLAGAVDAAAEAVDRFFGGSTDLEDVSPENPGGGYIEGYDERGIPIDSESSGGISRTPWESGAQSTQYDRDTSPAFSGLRAGAGLGSFLRDSADAAGLLGSALSTLNPEIMRSNENFNTTASTVPIYTGATEDASGATGAMAGSMGNDFADVASSAYTNFVAMQADATTRTAALNRIATADTNSMRASVLNNMLQMRSGASSNASGMQSAVTGQMLGMRTSGVSQLSMLASSANTQTSNMQSYAATNASGMRSSVAGSMLGMRTASALQMGLMASSSKTSGSQMDSGLTGWMTGARVRIVASMAGMVQSVRNTGSAGYSAGHYAGSRIGEGMAAGMNAWLGNIRASAIAMVAAASAAVAARAMISSPSRLFMQYGEFIGEGLEIGMRNMIPEIGRTADRMIPSPEFNTPINRGGYGGGTQIIDNSTHTTEFVALKDKQFHELLQAKERTNRMYSHLSDPDAHNYGGSF